MSKYGVFSGLYFPAFELNTERYGISLRIQTECGKTRTRQNSVFGHFSRSVVLDQNKKLSVSWILIANFCLCRTNFLVPWAVFSCYLKLFSKFPKLLAIFPKLVFFQHPLAQLRQLCQQEWVKTLKFFFFFLTECFDRIFLWLEYSIQLLFKYHFTENHGAFEAKTYQQNCYWKMQSFKRPRKSETWHLV